MPWTPYYPVIGSRMFVMLTHQHTYHQQVLVIAVVVEAATL